MDKIKRIKELTEQLNLYRDEYYNNHNSPISDYEYDTLLDELQSLENETGFVLNNSPTQTVGYEVKSKLQKVIHSHPMLSLDKTKSVDDIRSFLNGRVGIAMLKMDGLTTGVSYSDGKLISAETRGNGVIGEDVLHNARTIKNLPQQITETNLSVDGEVVIARADFEQINATITNEDDKYKNPRNLASGSIRQLDSKVAAKRSLRFIAWKCVNGIDDNSFINRLNKMREYGFEVVPHRVVSADVKRTDLENIIEELKSEAENKGFPIDGIVFGYDDVAYGESLGATGHHMRSQIAYKFYDEEVTTILRNIEWSCGKTGNLTPIAIFDSVDLDGTEVSRASLHNISICKDLQLGIGDEITVYKANMVIPQIRENLTKSNTFTIPDQCPVCGAPTVTVKDNDTEVLNCINETCSGKLLGRVSHFVSKKGMDIEGLSEATLEKFISLGWITNLFDVYGSLRIHYPELIKMNGFGKRSVEKLDKAIEKSKEVELKNFIAALSIPGIGTSQAKALARKFGTWYEFQNAGFGTYNFSQLDNFGEVLNRNIHNWFKTMWNEDRIGQLTRNLRIINTVTSNFASNILTGKVFVITGSVKHFTNRKELQETIETYGGKVSSSVTSKIHYLINNDVASNSSKNKKAKELGIPILSEIEFLRMIRE